MRSVDEHMPAPIRLAPRDDQFVVDSELAPNLPLWETVVDEKPGFRIAVEKGEEIVRWLVEVWWTQPVTPSRCRVSPEEKPGRPQNLRQAFPLLARSYAKCKH